MYKRQDFDYTAPKKVVNDSDMGTGEFQINYASREWDTTLTEGCYQGDEKWSDVQDEYLTFAFTGTSVKYYASVAAHHGIGAFSIDDGEETMVDFYSASRANQVLLYDSGNLENGKHVLKVRVTGTKMCIRDSRNIWMPTRIGRKAFRQEHLSWRLMEGKRMGYRQPAVLPLCIIIRRFLRNIRWKSLRRMRNTVRSVKHCLPMASRRLLWRRLPMMRGWYPSISSS